MDSVSPHSPHSVPSEDLMGEDSVISSRPLIKMCTGLGLDTGNFLHSTLYGLVAYVCSYVLDLCWNQC